ncbi:GFA family protein [Parvibaculum sp.]|uniref:GFA family protein n=1 Tax=Parvibaculum sp. TaxID=2024848 RepID=UPI002C2FBB60|nr:GFA family protein [Parvibaculum sp.]HUD52615.1 GFA family protein [Parvibaculum sp.]
MDKPKRKTLAKPQWVEGRCLCSAVALEIQYPARWAFHDHGRAARIAHGAAYATYVGSWRKRFRVTEGEDALSQYEDPQTKVTRSFCTRCGTPLFYETARSPHMVNIPRALFASRVGREPRYHLRISELQDWTYAGEKLGPLKGFPGVVWERPHRAKKRPPPEGMF